MNRREFVATSGVAAIVGAAGRAMGQEEPNTLPRIRLGDLEVSRFVLGSNPFFGFAHQTDELAQEMIEYYTDSRIREVLDASAALGVTAVAAPPYDRWIELWKTYRDEGGALTEWLSQPDPAPEDMLEVIDQSVEGGASAVFIQGARVDEQFDAGTPEVVRGWIERIKEHGLPAGMASHRATTHPFAEEAGWPTDFYFQCFYNPHIGYLEEHREAAVATIARIEKPVIGYKILAAGRNDPDEAFAYAFKQLRDKDGVCVGIFPKHRPTELADNIARVG